VVRGTEHVIQHLRTTTKQKRGGGGKYRDWPLGGGKLETSPNLGGEKGQEVHALYIKLGKNHTSVNFLD